jgi:fructokinase
MTVLVAGEALVDLTPVVGAPELLYRPCPGGGPFNTAVGLGRLGVPTAFFGRLSTDSLGRLLAHRLDDAGVDLRHALRGPEPTPLALVSHGTDGAENEYSFYVEGTAERLVTPADLPTDLDGVRALHVGTLGLSLTPIAVALELLVGRHAADVVVGFDPNVRPGLVADRASYVARLHRIAALADVVKVSEADAAWIAPDLGADGLAEQWRSAGAAVVVVTRGGAGAEAHGPQGRVAVPAHPTAVVDTVGAGDSFNAGLLAWLHDHDRLTKDAVRSLGPDDLADALRFASLVSAVTCSRAGADPPRRHELP